MKKVLIAERLWRWFCFLLENVCELYVGKAGRTWYQGELGIRENMVKEEHGTRRTWLVSGRTWYKWEHGTRENIVPSRTWYLGKHSIGRTWYRKNMVNGRTSTKENVILGKTWYLGESGKGKRWYKLAVVRVGGRQPLSILSQVPVWRGGVGVLSKVWEDKMGFYFPLSLLSSLLKILASPPSCIMSHNLTQTQNKKTSKHRHVPHI